MRVVILRTDRLGEMLLTLPLAAALRQGLPDAHLTMVVQSAHVDLVRCHSDVGEVLATPWTGHQFGVLAAERLARVLRAGRFGVAIVANPHKWLHWAVWRAHIPRRIGYDRKWAWCLTDRLPDRKAHGLRHDIEWNLDLARPLGVAVPRPIYGLSRDASALRRVRDRLTQAGWSFAAPVVALHPWASTTEKRWPGASFQALARALAAAGWTVAVIGGTEHHDEARAWARGVPATDLVGALTLVELAAFLSQCALLITNDSGPAHVAAAMGTPTITLFGSPHAWQGPIRWRPWGDRHAVVHRVPITSITVDEVMQIIKERFTDAAPIDHA